MTSPVHGLEIQIHFSQSGPLISEEMHFTVRHPELDNDTYVFTKRGKSWERGKNVYDWNVGTKAVVLAILDFKLKGRKNSGIYAYQGASKRSPAASACSVIDKKRKRAWLQDAFGPLNIAKEVFTSHTDSNEETVAFGIDSTRLPPENIHVFRHGSEVELKEREIEELSAQLLSIWRPLRRSPTRAIMPDCAKATASKNSPTVRPSMLSRTERPSDFDLRLGRALLIQIRRNIRAHKWENAAAECEIAEKLFANSSHDMG